MRVTQEDVRRIREERDCSLTDAVRQAQKEKALRWLSRQRLCGKLDDEAHEFFSWLVLRP